MEAFSEKEAARQLRHFDAVWARVTGSRTARDLAAEAGLPLMPRRTGCRRRRRPCPGTPRRRDR